MRPLGKEKGDGERPKARGWVWMVALCLVGALLAWGIHSSMALGSRRPLATCAPGPSPFLAHHGLREVRAALHVHTTFSWDGVGTVAQAADDARSAGIEAVLLAEHDNTDSWPAGGFREGVLVLPGVEVSTPRGHHLVWGVPAGAVDSLYDLHRTLYNRKPTPESMDSLAIRTGGATFVAHPRGTNRPWEGEIPATAAGLEIANLDALWRDDPWRDLLSGDAYALTEDEPRVDLSSYALRWLKA